MPLRLLIAAPLRPPRLCAKKSIRPAGFPPPLYPVVGRVYPGGLDGRFLHIARMPGVMVRVVDLKQFFVSDFTFLLGRAERNFQLRKIPPERFRNRAFPLG